MQEARLRQAYRGVLSRAMITTDVVVEHESKMLETLDEEAGVEQRSVEGGLGDYTTPMFAMGAY